MNKLTNLANVLVKLKLINESKDNTLGSETAAALASRFRKAWERSGLTWEKSPSRLHAFISTAEKRYAEERNRIF